MAKKEFTYYGKSLEEVKNLSLREFAELTPARIRRSLKRGLPDKHKLVLKKLKKGEPNVETHCRDMIIIPEMIEKTISVHNGKSFIKMIITPEMIGHYLGEFAGTRRGVSHSAPGIGATRSSSALSVK